MAVSEGENRAKQDENIVLRKHTSFIDSQRENFNSDILQLIQKLEFFYQEHI